MQDIGKELGVNIGFLFRKQDSFENGAAELEKTDPDLAAYIRRTREWSEPLMMARNDLEHSASVHQRMNYTVSGTSVMSRLSAGSRSRNSSTSRLIGCAAS